MRPCDRCFAEAASHFEARRIPEALAAYSRAESLGYCADRCAAGRWSCWMLLGHFARAWAESDAIAARGGPDPHRFWDGRPLEGKRLMLRCLHGLGDSIQFIRFAPQLRRRCARLIVETHPELVSLLRGVEGVDEVVTWGRPSPEWDSQIEIMEVPRVLGLTLDSLPGRVPYIAVEGGRVERSRRALAALGGGADSGPPQAKPPAPLAPHSSLLGRAGGAGFSLPAFSGALKVGLLWASSGFDPARTMPLTALAPVLQVAGCSFYSLQAGPAAAEVDCVREICELRQIAVNTSEIADTAATVLNLDLVITVDTMMAHLAGALGVPVWTMLAFRADWRWMLDREDSPWYPAMRLFRQNRPGDWSSVAERVAEELRSYRFFDCSGSTM